MSEKKVLPDVSEQYVADNSVQKLEDRPNRSNQYGQSGLSANQLKERFDRLADTLAKNTRDVSKIFAGEDAGKYITVSGVDGYNNLYDLIAAMLSGAFAAEVLKLYPDEMSSTKGNNKDLKSLQGVINKIAKLLNGDDKTLNSVRYLIAAAVAGLIGGADGDDTSKYNTLKTLYDALGDLKTLVGEGLPEGVIEETVIAYIKSVDEAVENEISNRGTAISEALQEARGYANTAETDAKSYADTKKDEAEQYTDGKVTYLQGEISTAKKNAISESKAYTDKKVADLVNGAPTTLDTLKEIADAFSENKEVVETLDAAIGSKVGTEAYNAKVAELDGDMAGKLDAKFEAIDENIIRLVVAYPDGSIKAEKIATGGSY